MSKDTVIEHPKKSGIKIRVKVNQSGLDTYGVSYEVTVPAKVTNKGRQRKQFPSKEKAEEWAEDQWTGFSKQGEEFFRASPEERNEFANLIPKLRAAGVSLTEAIEFALPRIRPAGGDKTLSEVIAKMQASKAEMLKRKILRDRSERTFRTISNKIAEEFGSTRVRELTLDAITKWTKTLKKAPRTIKNYLNIFSEILNEAKARSYVLENVLDRLTKTDRKELYGIDNAKAPEILSVNEAQRLLLTAHKHPEHDLLGAVTLALYCGIRTEELKRLQWKDVRLDEGFVTIGADIAKKRRIRNVTIPENALAWLTCCPERTGAVTRSAHYNDYQKRFQKLLKAAGFTEKYIDEGEEKERIAWKNNAMRHSFGSYHFALHGDSIKTSNELGHKQGDNVLFEHYRALTTKKSGEKYFEIQAPKTRGKTTQFKQSA
mgnify:CR=1 FL=1